MGGQTKKQKAARNNVAKKKDPKMDIYTTLQSKSHAASNAIWHMVISNI